MAIWDGLSGSVIYTAALSNGKLGAKGNFLLTPFRAFTCNLLSSYASPGAALVRHYTSLGRHVSKGMECRSIQSKHTYYRIAHFAQDPHLEGSHDRLRNQPAT